MRRLYTKNLNNEMFLTRFSTVGRHINLNAAIQRMECILKGLSDSFDFAWIRGSYGYSDNHIC